MRYFGKRVAAEKSLRDLVDSGNSRILRSRAAQFP